MKKRFIAVILIALSVLGSAWAAEWWEGQKITGFDLTGIKNVSSSEINSALYPFRGEALTEQLASEMETRLRAVDGILTVSTGVTPAGDGEVRMVFSITELPRISAVRFSGNSRVKSSTLTSGLTSLVAGQFIEPSNRALQEAAKAEVQAVYTDKGFLSIPVDLSMTVNEEANTVAFDFTISEGIQSRIVEIAFEGNDNVSASMLKKQITSKVKSLFNQGYLNLAKLETDASAIEAYYQTLGYIDAEVTDTRIEDVEGTNANYRDVKVTFAIDEKNCWYYGGMTVSGNTIFSDEELGAFLTMKEGAVLNLQQVQEQYAGIAGLYYDNGYISNAMNIDELRNPEAMTISFNVSIAEGPQAIIEDILITGLKKTKDYVMRRELAFAPGDVFSRAKLQTSAQNLYNTGFISSLDYDLYYGNEENGVIVEFIVEESSSMSVTFGMTFGGNVNGFPISGYAQFSDNNVGGTGRTLAVATELNPTDSQKVSLTFGNTWVADKRWANSVTLAFSRTLYSGELQKGTTSDFYDGRNESSVWPLGYDSSAQWIGSGKKYPGSRYLMDYRLLNVSLTYNTGYTFIYDVGRLGLSAGVTVGLNHALYDNYYIPYEKLIYKYAQAWQFSNKLSLGIQWDGRDYIQNTTKGYVVGTSVTYAGGLLQGLSNYIRLTGNAAGYLKLFEVGSEESRKNIMLCISTSVNLMLSQFYNNPDDGGWGWHDPKLGATKYEMLYIDGMTVARGFDTVTDFAFLWDNMVEVSYPLVENLLQAEVFVSATAGNTKLSSVPKGCDWYFAGGAGIKLKISGFPLGLYLVKNAKYDNSTGAFSWVGGSIFHRDSSPNSGIKLVLAISTSLI